MGRPREVGVDERSWVAEHHENGRRAADEHRKRWAANVGAWRADCERCEPSTLCDQHAEESTRREPCENCGTSVLFDSEDAYHEAMKVDAHFLCDACERAEPIEFKRYVEARALCAEEIEALEARLFRAEFRLGIVRRAIAGPLPGLDEGAA